MCALRRAQSPTRWAPLHRLSSAQPIRLVDRPTDGLQFIPPGHLAAQPGSPTCTGVALRLSWPPPLFRCPACPVVSNILDESHIIHPVFPLGPPCARSSCEAFAGQAVRFNTNALVDSDLSSLQQPISSTGCDRLLTLRFWTLRPQQNFVGSLWCICACKQSWEGTGKPSSIRQRRSDVRSTDCAAARLLAGLSPAGVGSVPISCSLLSSLPPFTDSFHHRTSF